MTSWPLCKWPGSWPAGRWGAGAGAVQAPLAGLQDREAKEARQAMEFLIRLQKGQVNQVITGQN